MKESKFILGTVQFGMNYGVNNSNGQPSRDQVYEILQHASENNISVLDTADAYGNAPDLIGDFIKSTGNKFKVNTKFKNYLGNDIDTQVISTLGRLGLDQINIFFYHSFEEFIQYPYLLEQLLKLKDCKRISKIGVSVYDNKEFQMAIEHNDVDVIQLPFNLLDNYSQRGEFLKLAKIKGKEIQVRSVFLQGLFFRRKDSFPLRLKVLLPYINKIESIRKSIDATTESLALRYVNSQVEINNILIGVDSLTQLQNNLSIGKEILDEKTKLAIDSIKVLEKELLNPSNWI